LKTLEYPNTYTYSATFLTTVGVNLVSFINLSSKNGMTIDAVYREKNNIISFQ
jgi:hypothetical protein